MKNGTDLGFHDETKWRCSCGNNLTLNKVAARYLGSRFEIELPACVKDQALKLL
jgi:hypothetical protein